MIREDFAYFGRFFDTFIAPSMGKKVTNGGNCRWATCYDDLCAARVLRFPSLILKELLLPGGAAHKALEFLLPSHPSRNDKYLTSKSGKIC